MFGPSTSTFHGLSGGKISQPETVVPTPTIPPGTPPGLGPASPVNAPLLLPELEPPAVPELELLAPPPLDVLPPPLDVLPELAPPPELVPELPPLLLELPLNDDDEEPAPPSISEPELLPSSSGLERGSRAQLAAMAASGMSAMNDADATTSPDVRFLMPPPLSRTG